MAKSAVFGAMHIVIAFCVTYVMTGNAWVASAVTVVEPLINTVAHYFFDEWWDHPPAAFAVFRRGGGAREQATAAAG